MPIVGAYNSISDSAAQNQAIGSIPASGAISSGGFMLCDGSLIPTENRVNANFRGKFTPVINDNRFIMGTLSNSIGTKAGINSYTLTENNIPQHSHSGITGERDLVHQHDMTHNHPNAISNPAGNHNHIIVPYEGPNLSFNGGGGGMFRIPYTRDANTDNIGTNFAGEHIHTIQIANSTRTLTDSRLGIHSHTINPYGSGSPTPIPIIPEYIGAVYLIRVVN